jgi:hypothetical protein
MHRYTRAAVALALALSISALPAAALAKEDSSGGDGSANSGGSGQGGTSDQIGTSGSNDLTGSRLGEDATNSNRGRVGEDATNSNRGPGNGNEGTSSNRGPGNENEGTSSNRGEDESLTEDVNDDHGLHLELESTTTRANSLADLRQKVADRRHELDDEEASSTPDREDIMKNANDVRIAVLSFLAAQNLLGANGLQIATLVALVNQSLASTTNAEAEIHDRGALTRFFFGGDAVSADVIAQAVAANQVRIDNLKALLNQANVPLNIQTELNAQITVLEDQQTRLQDLALKEKSQWGLFSWRFGS